MSPALHSTSDACRGDGVCVDVCPQLVLQLRDGRAATDPQRASTCIRCGACVAVCPNGALTLEGFTDDAFPPAGSWATPFDEFLAFLRSRRSVRTFRDVPVADGLIEQIVEAAAAAPMGFPPHTTELIVLVDAAARRELLERLVAGYDELLWLFRHALGRAYLRAVTGAQTYRTLRDHIVGATADANERYRLLGEDRYTYNAPVVMLFHADRFGVAYVANAYIAATHAMLAAHALGLGATMLDIVAPIVNRSKELRHRFGVPRGNDVVVALVVGHPRYRYARGVRRQLRSVRTI